MMAMSYNDPVTMAFSLTINPLGNLELTKLNNNGDLVDGTIFTVNGPGYNGDVEVRNGKSILILVIVSELMEQYIMEMLPLKELYINYMRMKIYIMFKEL